MAQKNKSQWRAIKTSLADRFKDNLFTTLSQTLEPIIKPNICDWASNNFNLPATMSRPGLYNPDFCPYQREILETLAHDDDAKEVVLLMGSQTGKTQSLLIYLDYAIVHSPSLIKFLLPSSDLGDQVSADRVASAIEYCKPVKVLSSPQERRDGKNSVRRKEFYNGASLTIGNTALPRDVTSTPSRICLVDEYSKAIDHPNPNGDVISLIRQRQETFYDSKLLIASTPLDEGTCLITKEYQNSDQREWENQCLGCGEYFAPKFADLHWDNTVNDPDTAHIKCPCCGYEHNEIEHKNFVKVGRWVKRNPGHKRAGFFINSFSSPFTNLPALVQSWLDAQGDAGKLKQIVNEKFCETWSIAGQKHDDDIHERAEHWDGDAIPNNVIYLTAGVDIQDDRIEAVVVGHGEQFETYHVERLVIAGSIRSNDTQDSLLRSLRYPYTREDGVPLKLMKVFVDSGYLPEEVKTMCNRFKRYNFAPIKGATTGEAVPNKKTYRGADKALPINVSKIKEVVFARLKLKPDPEKEIDPGVVHFSRTCDEDYFTQLCSETPEVERKAGHKRVIWKKNHDRNEVWDCVIYANAAADSLPYSKSKLLLANLKRELAKMEGTGLSEPAEINAPEPEKEPIVPKERPVREKPNAANKYAALLKATQSLNNPRSF